MEWLKELLSSLRSLFRRGQEEQQLNDELQFHLERQIEQNRAAGMSPEEARHAALRLFGGVEQTREECRDMRRVNSIENLIQDLRYGLRMLRMNPGFTAVAVVTLALGIGANAAIFTVVNTVLLRPLPFLDAQRLVMVGETDRKETPRLGEVSYPNFLDWKKQNHVFESMAAFHTATFTLTGEADALHIQGAVVSADIFALLGVPPRVGRAFLPEEDEPGGGSRGLPVVVSHAFWQRHFSASPGVLGREIELGNKSFTVIGVMPQGFQFPIAEPIDLWTTIGIDAESADSKPHATAQRETRYLQVIARLKPGITVPEARADLSAVARNLERQYPGPDSDTGAWVVPEFDALVGDIRPALLILLGAVGLLLLIACANMASLMLARAAGRRREIAVRCALGAGRYRIIHQLITESVLLSSLGAAVGLPIAVWAVHVLILLEPTDLPRIEQVSLDGRVFGFTLLLALLTALLFGLIPALAASHGSLTDSLKSGGLTIAGVIHGGRLRNALVVGETALSLVLLASAGLLIQSFWRLIKVDPGFDRRQVLTFRLDLPSARYSEQQRVRFYRQLLRQLEALPGVGSASAIEPLPMSGANVACSFGIEGRPTPQGVYWNTDFHVVALNYFHTMGVPLSEGRDFTPRDDLASVPVAIINRTLAQRYFPDEDPVGRRIRPAISNGYKEAPWREIVGVAAGTRDRALNRAPGAEVYVPQAQSPMQMTIVVRTRTDPKSIIGAVRDTVKSLDKSLPVYDVRMLQQYLAISAAEPRFNALLLGIFSALALILSAIGLYGVISYAVAQRTHEIGVRMALGAMHRDILAAVVRLGLRLALTGAVIGLVGALAVTRILKNMLFGVKATDPVTFITVSLILIAVELLACFIPARRATAVDPMVALRYE